MLEAQITTRIGGFTLDVDLQAHGGVTALFGPSGAGKTSLARAIAGLSHPERGRIALNGKVLLDGTTNVPAHHRGIGYVFQEPRLFPHLDVRANLLYGARPGQDPGPVADMLGIEGLLHRRPAGLSGGEAARVAIGRALLRDPKLLILDEPLAALDAPRRSAILPWLERLRDRGLPVLYISHAMEEVARLADTLVLLREGRIAHAGPLAESLADPSLTPLIGPSQAGAVLTAEVAAQADGVMTVRTPVGALHVPGSAALGHILRLRVRAEDIIIATSEPMGLSALNVLPVTIDALHAGDGPAVMVRLRAGDGFLLARVTKRSVQALTLEPGRPVWAVVKTTAFAHGDVGTARPNAKA